MYIADALSRAFPKDIVTDNFEREIAEEKCIHLMSTEAYVTDRTLRDIKAHMYTDNQMRLLTTQMKQGWPSTKSLVQREIKKYYQYRERLSENDGLVYSGRAILIPPTLQRDTLHKLHKSHQGIEKTKQFARQTIFWPGMSAQIEDLISKCATCQRNRSSNPKEPLHPHQLPQRPWQRVATDLFEWNKCPHLLVVDYYSGYPEVAELRDMRTKTR
ncbi:uncharacterized protein K02A2.6-like [Acropora millepora]|uniref:uncharacterized protein K02A2.6-like n=1 Tax=Acropora millepora TaxID=45264 RepID=UPI001CF369A2|nr:uncharacterized protein K02A2.6-like [Acropora millepora]